MKIRHLLVKEIVIPALVVATVVTFVACSKPVIPPVVKPVPVPAAAAPAIPEIHVLTAPDGTRTATIVKDGVATSTIRGIPPKAEAVHHVKVKSKHKDGAVYVGGERIGKGECNALFAYQLLNAVDSKIDSDIEVWHKIRNLGNVLTHPSVVRFRAKCASLPA